VTRGVECPKPASGAGDDDEDDIVELIWSVLIVIEARSRAAKLSLFSQNAANVSSSAGLLWVPGSGRRSFEWVCASRPEVLFRFSLGSRGGVLVTHACSACAVREIS
jgi:hypothetical protein